MDKDHNSSITGHEAGQAGCARGFGEFLRETRLAKGLSIRQLATMAGVSNAYLSQVETGARGVPSPKILKRLARPLSITPTRFLEIAGYISRPQPITNPTIDIEGFLRQDNVRFTLGDMPVTPEDVEALIRFLRNRHPSHAEDKK